MFDDDSLALTQSLALRTTDLEDFRPRQGIMDDWDIASPRVFRRADSG